MRPIVLTVVVRDERDAVAACLAYHLSRGIDLVLVTDHGSTDGTTDVLATYAADGRVRFWRESGEGFEQSRWVTRMARVAALEHDAAWVLHADADEFWWPEDGDLRTLLAAVPSQIGGLIVPRSNFLPTPHETGAFWERMVHRDTRSTNPLGIRLPPKVCHRGTPDVLVANGNHSAAGAGPLVAGDGLIVLHYPARSRAQVHRKFVRGATAVDAAAVPAQDYGTWRQMRDGAAGGAIDRWYDQQLALAASGPPRIVVDARLREHLLRQAVVA